MAVGYLTSSTLIDTVKREAMLPSSQSTFTESDFLSIANQEMRIGLVPSIMQYHEEYFVRDSAPVTIEANQSSYAIPYRAIGGKLRSVHYLDSNNNVRAMTRIMPDDRAHFQNSSVENHFLYFYIQGDEIVLLPDVGSSVSGSLVFSFYMRPNELVSESRVATIEAISTTDMSGSITAISAASPAVITSASHGLSTGNIIEITGSNSTPSVDGTYTITVIDANSFSVPITTTVAGTQGTWDYSNTIYTVDQIPDGFTTTTPLDLLQTRPGHKTYGYDQLPLLVDGTNLQIVFKTSQVRKSALGSNLGLAPIVGDYIAFAGECIIPQAPADLHDMLCQRVVVRCLQALGDKDGFAMAMAKLAEMEKYSPTMIDNRTESNPIKANNLKSTLRVGKIRRRRRW